MMRRFRQKDGQVLPMSKTVSLKIEEDDAQLLLNLVNQVNAKGKESMIQVLRIIESLESVIPVVLETDTEK
jgi:hypothetical protein